MSYIEDLSAITTPSLTDLLYIYQNGDDFKVTNQQLLDLIKTNTVIPITQSDYDDLTPAEKNNGSIYIITDASITADDIEYSSGVSVGDKLDDLSNLTKLIFSGNISKTISAGGVVAITGSELGSLPAGYTPIGLLSQYTTNTNVSLISYDIATFGSASQFGLLKNWGTTDASVIVNYRTLVMKSAYVS